ncbi:MAG: peptide-methionine (S)-S-oxide reductase [Acidiferrobacteraceae bacterium]|nr:peptide-methionine (S)-S-oxide reductase [Acidiferrobacteraceae bacterium]
MLPQYGVPTKLISQATALPGRTRPIEINNIHHVSGLPLKAPFPSQHQLALFGLGCFWGAERVFWLINGIYSTAVGYSGGFTPNPTYEEVCSGLTGHTEVVQIVYDPAKISYAELLVIFWEAHDPTHGMRQGNDIGTQYRSAIYTFDSEQQELATASKHHYGANLSNAGRGKITTEIKPARSFFYAEEYHQQYLSKNPNGYCGIGGTGICFENNP